MSELFSVIFITMRTSLLLVSWCYHNVCFVCLCCCSWWRGSCGSSWPVVSGLAVPVRTRWASLVIASMMEIGTQWRWRWIATSAALHWTTVLLSSGTHHLWCKHIFRREQSTWERWWASEPSVETLVCSSGDNGSVWIRFNCISAVKSSVSVTTITVKDLFKNDFNTLDCNAEKSPFMTKFHTSGAAVKLPQPRGLPEGPAGPWWFPGLPGLGHAQQQWAASAEQALAVRRGGGADGAEAGLCPLSWPVSASALSQWSHMQQSAIWW